MIGFIEKHHKLLLEKKKEDGVSENAPKKLSKKDLEIDPDVDDAPEDDENKTSGSSNPELENIIISFFQDTDNITDEDIHKLAEILGIPTDELETNIYTILKKLINKQNIGKHSFVSDNNYNKKELDLGEEIEKEHTSDSKIAKEIAKDHLTELPDYYSRLRKMEKNENNNKNKIKNVQEDATSQKPGPRYTFFSLNRGPESDKFFPEETRQEQIKKMMQKKLATNPYYRSDEKH